jgi:thiamine-phosphate pyrophosphorylase
MIDFRLYLITDRKSCLPKTLSDVIRTAVSAGVRAVQLREKDFSMEEMRAQVEALSSIVQDRGGKLLVNRASAVGAGDREFVDACGACDGYHLPEDCAVSEAMHPGEILLGISTHSAEQAVGAEKQGASFITFGPIFDTPSKRQYGPPQGCGALAEVAGATNLPVFAVGGITPDNAAECLQAGAHGVAVISAIMNSPDIERVVGRFQAVLGEL